MAYATVDDVAARLGVDPATLNTAQVEAYLDDTTALITAYTGVDFSADPPYPEVPADIVAVTCSRTIRMLNNPDGIRQETIGTYSYSMAADAATIMGGWTDWELAVLNGYGSIGGTRRGGEFAVGW